MNKTNSWIEENELQGNVQLSENIDVFSKWLKIKRRRKLARGHYVPLNEEEFLEVKLFIEQNDVKRFEKLVELRDLREDAVKLFKIAVDNEKQ